MTEYCHSLRVSVILLSLILLIINVTVRPIRAEFLQKCEAKPEEGECPTGYKFGDLPNLFLIDLESNSNITKLIPLTFTTEDKMIGPEVEPPQPEKAKDGSRDSTNSTSSSSETSAIDSAESFRKQRIVVFPEPEPEPEMLSMGEPEPESEHFPLMIPKKKGTYQAVRYDGYDDKHYGKHGHHMYDGGLNFDLHGMDIYPHYSKERKYTENPQDYCTHGCQKSIYRTLDGSCNNLMYPNWGRANGCFNRLLKPAYEDGRQAMKVSSVYGPKLPGPRLVSEVIHAERDNPEGVNQLLMQWGQLLDHDMSFTAFPTRPDLSPILCCKGEYHPDCRPIRVPKDDPFFPHFGVKCLEFVRSSTCFDCHHHGFRERNGKHGHDFREQLNTITAFIDASVLYGNNHSISALIRSFKHGMLKTSASISGHMLLPLSENPEDQCTRRPEFDLCYMSGDIRVNQQPGLTTLHTIMLRQHNRIAMALHKINPHWSDETIFQEARRIVGAQFQYIAYNEYLPIILGHKVMDHYKLTLLKHGRTHYNSKINPSIINSFHTAAFRFAHSQVDGRMRRISKHGKVMEFNLRDVFFNPRDLLYDKLDDLIRGMLYVPAQTVDPFLDNDLRNHLYKAPKDSFGTDLASLNIQRGRDNGIPGYTKFLEFCYNAHISSWKDLEQFIPPKTLSKLSSLYKDPEDIDLWTGGISEYRMEGGGLLGPTFSCMIGIQFYRLKFGDRFWHEHAHQDGSFTDMQLQSIRQTTLARFLCANSDHMSKIHLNVFQGPSKMDPPRHCEEIPDIDISAWKDQNHHGSYHSHSEPHSEPHHHSHKHMMMPHSEPEPLPMLIPFPESEPHHHGHYSKSIPMPEKLAKLIPLMPEPESEPESHHHHGKVLIIPQAEPMAKPEMPHQYSKLLDITIPHSKPESEPHHHHHSHHSHKPHSHHHHPSPPPGKAYKVEYSDPHRKWTTFLS